MTLDEIQLLFDYDRWADQKIIGAVAPLTEEKYKKDLNSSFGGVLGTLVHILSANRVWLCRWTGQTAELLKAEKFPNLEMVMDNLNKFHSEMNGFLRTLTEEKINRPLRYTDFRGNEYAQKLCQQMQHKINHSSYHRGQIITMLRQLGDSAVSTDLINYLRQNGKQT